MKENYPIEMAEYAKGNQFQGEFDFQWWVSYTLKKIDAIISSVKARLMNNSIKYGIKVLRNVQEVKRFNMENINTSWQDDIDFEVATIMPTIDLIDGTRHPPGFTKSSGYLVFDVKMDFTLKTR